MANQEQLDEFEFIQAVYDGTEDVCLRLNNSPVEAPKSSGCNDDLGELELEAQICVDADVPENFVLLLHVLLEPGYLAAESWECCQPSFKLSSSSLSRSELSKICKELDRLFLEQAEGPILFTWLEWLRMESATFLTLVAEQASLKQHCSGVDEPQDPRAIVLDEQPHEQQNRNLSSPSPNACANCCSVVDNHAYTCAGICKHVLCFKCTSAVVQVHNACGSTPRCPLPQCRSEMTAEAVESVVVPELWISVSKRIMGTPFQDSVVFCPKCEDLGMDMPVLTATSSIEEAADAGVCRCRCFNCSWMFCGVCRSPSHPGESCSSDESRVVRMTKRRPPLPPELAAMAWKAASEILESEKARAKELEEALRTWTEDFEGMRKAFLAMHEDRIYEGLGSVFGGAITLTPTPLARSVVDKFVSSIRTLPSVEMRPAFHGTDAANHNSIVKRGLLIPGQGNELKVAHGAAHGKGVYTANVDAAWLSRGFCSAPTMLVCAVLQSDAVRHVGDAMVVSKEEHVVPMFEGAGQCFGDQRSPVTQVTQPAKTTAAAGAPSAKHAVATGCTKGTAKAKGNVKTRVCQDKSSKSSKFKASLAAQSNRH